MRKQTILYYIKKLRRPVFTTQELAALSGKSSSVVTQSLNSLKKHGFVFKVYRGIWAEAENENFNPYHVIPFLSPRHRMYVSFISALHLHGVIEQIPQMITLASTAHTKIIRTTLGTYSIHRISPLFFDGFSWYRNKGSFLIAEPEKALVDSLYLSACRKKQFGYFPELHFPRSFSIRKTWKWAKKIPDSTISCHVQKKLEILLEKEVKNVG